MAPKTFDGVPLSDLGRTIVKGASIQEVIDLLVEAHGSRPVLAAVEKHRKKPLVHWPRYASQVGTVELVKAGLGLKSDKAACEKIARILGRSDAAAIRQKLVRARAALRGTDRSRPEYRERHLQEEMGYWRKSNSPFEAWIRDMLKGWQRGGVSPF